MRRKHRGTTLYVLVMSLLIFDVSAVSHKFIFSFNVGHLLNVLLICIELYTDFEKVPFNFMTSIVSLITCRNQIFSPLVSLYFH